jgi:acyl-CoA-binding protein
MTGSGEAPRDATGGVFAACATRVASASGSRLTQEQQVALYGLYKQATVGPWSDCGAAAPAAWDITGIVKWCVCGFKRALRLFKNQRSCTNC